MKQGSVEWQMARCGHVTASRFRDVMTRPRNKGDKWGATNEAYLDELLAELLTGLPQDGKISAAINHGLENEPVAREELRSIFESDLIIPEGQYAYIEHQTEPGVGCSVDFLVGANATGEIKCPKDASKHAHRIRMGPDRFYQEVKAQVQGALWITGRRFAYCCSYSYEFPGEHRLLTFVFERDKEYIAELETRVLEFRDWVVMEYARISAKPF